MKLPEIIENIIHTLETGYEAFKVMLIAFAKSIKINGILKASKSSDSASNFSKIMPNMVFGSFVVIFLLAVFSNGVAVTSVQHDYGGNNSIHPQIKDLPPDTKLCSNCNGTGIITESYTDYVNKTCNHVPQTELNVVEMSYVIQQSTGSNHTIDGNHDAQECSKCHGSGWYVESVIKYRDVDCPVCGGKGYVPA